MSPDVRTPIGTSDVLNLGSGRKHFAGAINVDLVADTGPDVVHSSCIGYLRVTLVASASSPPREQAAWRHTTPP